MPSIKGNVRAGDLSDIIGIRALLAMYVMLLCLNPVFQTLENAGESGAKIHKDISISERLRCGIVADRCTTVYSFSVTPPAAQHPAAFAICARYRTTIQLLKPNTLGSIALPPDPSVHCAFHKFPCTLPDPPAASPCFGPHQPCHASCFFAHHIGQVKRAISFYAHHRAP